ncbi:MAG: DNA-methyltransferase [Candidatus Kariarchaeaceae archaeon]|jgi:site-specific DNA-methyltransferase (adenine-specific)
MNEHNSLQNLKNRIICGRTPEELLNIPSDSISLTITSPPFYDDQMYTLEDGSSEFGWNTYAEYLDHINETLSELYRITTGGGRLVLVLSNSPRTNEQDKIIDYWPIIHDTVVLSKKHGWILQDEAIWVKDEPSYEDVKLTSIPETQLVPYHDWITVLRKPGKFRKGSSKKNHTSSLWKLPPEGAQASYNKSYGSFPDEFIIKCLEIWSLPGDIILDPYAGSGQTVRIAIKMGRGAIGIESDPKWRSLWIDVNESRVDG